MKLGVDIGGSFIKFTDGKRLWKIPTPHEKAEIIETVSKVSKELQAEKIGVAVAGLINEKSGVVSVSPNLPFLNGVPLKENLQEKLGIPIIVVNDANAAAYGEYRKGSGRGSKVFVCLTLGTGLGGGAVINGELFTGVCGTAMEVGHIKVSLDGWPCHCGRNGCLEAYASSYGLERFYFVIKGKAKKSYEIIELAKDGEIEALRAVESLIRYLAVGIVNLVHLLNPDKIALGGGIVINYPDLANEIEKIVKKQAFNLPAREIRIVTAELGEFSGAVGAYLLTDMVSD